MKNIFLTETLIAHRGIHDNQKTFENTLEAFQLAIQKKYIIELDVHITKDKKIVVFHDYNTKRITRKNQIIEKTTYHDLNNQEVIHIPTLEEVLKLVNKKVPLLIELKQEAKVGELETELMKILNNYKGKYAIQSFNPKTLLWFKKNYPNILRGQLSCSFKNKKMSIILKFILKNMLLNPLTKPDFISYKYDELSQKKIEKLRKKNITLLAWTINEKDSFDTYKQLFDNLICEKII